MATWNPFMASPPHAIGSTSKLASRHCHASPPPAPPLPPCGGIGGTISLRRRGTVASARSRSDETSSQSGQQQQMDLSVLRFSLGIPGLDESYLPRYIGIGFGFLLVLNHLVAAAPPTSAQLTTETLGICLASFSAALPYIGKFLKGARPVDRSLLPEGNQQIFVMSENLLDALKEDLAWETFVFLRNTNTMSVLISVQDALCIRGYWNAPEATSKADIVDWFKRQIQEIGLSELNDALYFTQSTDQRWGILPKGATSLLLQPVLGTNQTFYKNEKINAFILLVSNASYAYRDRDRAWVRAVAKKFEAYLS